MTCANIVPLGSSYLLYTLTMIEFSCQRTLYISGRLLRCRRKGGSAIGSQGSMLDAKWDVSEEEAKPYTVGYQVPCRADIVSNRRSSWLTKTVMPVHFELADKSNFQSKEWNVLQRKRADASRVCHNIYSSFQAKLSLRYTCVDTYHSPAAHSTEQYTSSSDHRSSLIALLAMASVRALMLQEW